LRRRGRIKRLDERGPFILEGEAPLAALLGYRQWLRDLIQDDAYVGLRLSRYLPIDDDGPRAA
jgi:translation elongation factor EF-G